MQGMSYKNEEKQILPSKTSSQANSTKVNWT